jgi:hypothetical protein
MIRSESTIENRLRRNVSSIASFLAGKTVYRVLVELLAYASFGSEILEEKPKKWQLSYVSATSGETWRGYLESLTSIVNSGDDARVDGEIDGGACAKSFLP